MVAVVVACGHGTWLDEALYSIAEQDYPNLSVLVMEVGADDKVSDRVATFVPNAHFARMPIGTTFAQAANRALEMVDGAAHVLVCHDDVALAPDAVRLLLEEAYRSNAGLTCPKFVSWDNPDRLLSVGMGADRLGVVHPLVEPGELDQGQHDAAREVFVAPSGAVLVRRDLWQALGGFSTAASAPGEDLDLSWRAHLVGARVVVAPQARARHLEAGAKGLRRSGTNGRSKTGATKAGTNGGPNAAANGGSTNGGSGAAGPANSGPPNSGPPNGGPANSGPPNGVSMSSGPAHAAPANGGLKGTNGAARGPRARTRNKATADEQRLRVLWTCYGAAGLVLVAPIAVLFAFAESFWAIFHPGKRSGVLSPLRSLTRSVSRPKELWAARRHAQRTRRVSDLAIWKAQTRGSARLRALVRPSLERSHELAWAASRGMSAHDGPRAEDDDTAAVMPRAARMAGTGRLQNGVSQWDGEAAAGSVHRSHATSGDGTGTGLHDGDPSGSWDLSELTGQSGPAPAGRLSAPAKASWRLGAGTATVVVVLLLIGSRNILSQPLPILGQLPSPGGGVASWWHEWWSGTGPGPLATSSFAPPGLLVMALVGALSFGSVNVAVHLLVLVPLALGPLGVYMTTRQFGSQKGRAAATVLYAALPVPYNALSQGHWAGLVGYAAAPWVLACLGRLGGEAPYPALSWTRATGGLWVRFVALGLLVAVTASLAPATFLLVPIAGLALFVGSLLTGRGAGAAKFLLASLIATATGFVALLPWSLGAFRSFHDFFALTSGQSGALPLGSVLRMDTGPYGGVLGWALVAAAAIPLFIGRSWRLAWAARLWVVAFAFFGLAWAGSRGWVPVPPLELVLAPAGAAMALSVALGASAIERDLPGYRFGWRQFAPAFGAAAVVAATLPFLAWVGGGQWDLPASGAESAYAFPSAAPSGDYRVLWVGSLGSLPSAAQGSVGDLAFATSLDGLPSAGELWAPLSSGQAPLVAEDLGWAENRETTYLGSLFAPLAIRYVVVPVGEGAVGAAENRVAGALARQLDLVPVGTDPSYRVFTNESWLPLFSVLAKGTNLPTGGGQWATAARLQQTDLASAQPLPVIGSASASFDVRARPSPSHIYGAVEDGSWHLQAGGRALTAAGAVGWASTWVVPRGTRTVALSQRGAGGQHVADTVMVLAWALVLLVALVRLRARLRAQLNKTSVELTMSGAELPEIDWSSVWEEETVG
ncbi:MAG TPA: glycosyltransferase [Acidimicrobiales bacterium]|nr:glycosyltransferase [Acidimicrobiales bacterium]